MSSSNHSIAPTTKFKDFNVEIARAWKEFLKPNDKSNIPQHINPPSWADAETLKIVEDKVKEAFGTTEIADIARRILEKGEVQMTAEQRKEMLEAKRHQVVAYIVANAINPQTHTPHPPSRIEMALEEAKFHVDLFKPLDKEIEEAMKLLRPLIPIRFERSRIAIKLKGTDYGRCYDDLISYGIVDREVWTPEGDWIGSMEIPAGVITELTEKLKHKTRGSASVKLVNE